MIDLFQPNRYQTSGSRSTSTGGNQSFSGLAGDYGEKFLDKLMPQLQDEIGDYKSNINNWATGAKAGINKMATDNIRPAMGNMLEMLASRNMINSSMLPDTMKKMAAGTVEGVGNQMFNIDNSAAQQQMALLPLLGQLAELGKESRGQSVQKSESRSQTADPLEPYRLMADMYKSMM